MSKASQARNNGMEWSQLRKKMLRILRIENGIPFLKNSFPVVHDIHEYLYSLISFYNLCALRQSLIAFDGNSLSHISGEIYFDSTKSMVLV
jgi:hypothetical protein